MLGDNDVYPKPLSKVGRELHEDGGRVRRPGDCQRATDTGSRLLEQRLTRMQTRAPQDFSILGRLGAWNQIPELCIFTFGRDQARLRAFLFATVLLAAFFGSVAIALSWLN